MSKIYLSPTDQQETAYSNSEEINGRKIWKAQRSIEGRLETAEFKITPEAITSTVTQNIAGNDVVSIINQTATTLSISASKINLSGYVTISALGTAGQTTINGANITTGTLSADRIYGGTINGDTVNVINLNASNISGGTINAANINVSNLNASNITSGTIGTTYIPNLSASKITSGTMSADRISGGTITGVTININSGTFQVTSSGTVYLPLSGVSGTTKFNTNNTTYTVSRDANGFLKAL